MATPDITVTGLEVVERAFKELDRRAANKVIRKAERKIAKLFAAAIEERVPRRTGKLAGTIKVRSSKGTRSFKRQVSIAVLVGEAGRKGDEEKAAFYGFMQDHGFHVGRRIRRGKQVVGYAPLKGRLGSKGVRFIPGKRFTKKALRAVEPGALPRLVAEIAAGIEREARALGGNGPK